MIFLSALLASLSGLVVGERPVAPAQVELSAAATPVEAGEAAAIASVQAAPASIAPAVQPVPGAVFALIAAPAPDGRAHLNLKQSWLI